MRNRLRFRSDPAPFSLLHNKSFHDLQSAPESKQSLSSLAAKLSSNGASGSDLALDLVLNEIAEQVRVSTGATGVAIALTRSGELVCRAATGNAPDLGVRLNPYSGLSGLCLQTKAVQRCDDTETDPRVDIAACRSLKIRSIVMVPVVRRAQVLGLVESFSASPGYFGQRDTETLSSFCKPIIDALDLSKKAALVELESRKAGPQGGSFKLALSDIASPRSRSREQWAVLLICAVIATALLLGWMIGISARRTVAVNPPASPRARTLQVSGESATHNAEAVQPARVDKSPFPGVPAPDIPEPSVGEKGTTASALETKSTSPGNSDGGLVVSQNGKVIYRETPRSARGTANNISEVKGPTTVPAVDGRVTSANSAIIPAAKTELLAPENSNQYVTHRVQPNYPELARKQRKQGAVVLKVLVARDGGVQQVQALSGDPLLEAAAADAVVQWRFAPVFRLGQPVEFQTQITVDFKLP